MITADYRLTSSPSFFSKLSSLLTVSSNSVLVAGALQMAVTEYEAGGIEVPFLVNNNQKWISGIVEQTTCADIIKALLAAEGRLKGITEDGLEKFVLVERWRRVERPLKKESGLLKIWQAWGPEAKDVQFILKRVSSKKVSRPRTKVKRTNSKLIKQLTELEQKHPKYAGSDSDSEVTHMQDNIQVRVHQTGLM